MLIHLFAYRVPNLPKRELLRLFTGVQAVIGHTGFAKRFSHFSQMLFSGTRLRRHAEVRQTIMIVVERVFSLLDKGSVPTGNTPCLRQE